ncbi:hypothetical protein AGR8A_Cc50070 [Agrobacterium fabrum str. J-07]|nr:hypothetical protein AGR8A_Cc50070 [Agrobacterium fabrum str. J-07]
MQIAMSNFTLNLDNSKTAKVKFLVSIFQFKTV